jgi:hypothetical protein
MGGKSTFLRQVGLCVFLAQAGSFVPCESASIGLVDRIFTRVGASDQIARGASTFFVEMQETAAILRQATDRSLVLLDEVGRGTSTYDGLSLAWAVTEALHEGARAKPRTIFATHYHELTDLEDTLSRVRNRTVRVAEQRGEIVFLHQIAGGRLVGPASTWRSPRRWSQPERARETRAPRGGACPPAPPEAPDGDRPRRSRPDPGVGRDERAAPWGSCPASGRDDDAD